MSSILNTRPREQSASLTRLLEAAEFAVLHIPCLEIRPSADPEHLLSVSKTLSSDDWLLFTSANGVKAVSGIIDLERCNVGAIGRSTAEVVNEVRRPAEFVGSGIDSEEFGLEFKSRISRSGSIPKVVLLRGTVAGDALPSILTEAGFRVQQISVYESLKPVLNPNESSILKRISSGEVPDLHIFTSSLAIKNFVSLGAELSGSSDEFLAVVRSVPCAVIGKKTAQTAREYRFPVEVLAANSTIDSLVEGITLYFR